FVVSHDGQDAWVAGADRREAPAPKPPCVWGVASSSAASHPNPGSSGMVEFSEESRNSCTFPCLTHRHTPTSSAGGGSPSPTGSCSASWGSGLPGHQQ